MSVFGPKWTFRARGSGRLGGQLRAEADPHRAAGELKRCFVFEIEFRVARKTGAFVDSKTNTSMGAKRTR